MITYKDVFPFQYWLHGRLHWSATCEDYFKPGTVVIFGNDDDEDDIWDETFDTDEDLIGEDWLMSDDELAEALCDELEESYVECHCDVKRLASEGHYDDCQWYKLKKEEKDEG